MGLGGIKNLYFFSGAAATCWLFWLCRNNFVFRKNMFILPCKWYVHLVIHWPLEVLCAGFGCGITSGHRVFLPGTCMGDDRVLGLIILSMSGFPFALAFVHNVCAFRRSQEWDHNFCMYSMYWLWFNKIITLYKIVLLGGQHEVICSRDDLSTSWSSSAS